MDSVARNYTSEEEANKELIGILKSKGLSAEYQPRGFGGDSPDGIVEGILLEGKLDLANIGMTDRLIGQLQRYCSLGKPICVVLYGHARPDLLIRIYREVNWRYSKQVQIVHLDNAHRKRSKAWQDGY